MSILPKNWIDIFWIKANFRRLCQRPFGYWKSWSNLNYALRIIYRCLVEYRSVEHIILCFFYSKSIYFIGLYFSGCSMRWPCEANTANVVNQFYSFVQTSTSRWVTNRTTNRIRTGLRTRLQTDSQILAVRQTAAFSLLVGFFSDSK